MDDFNNHFVKNTIMYSTYEPEFIFAQLIGKLQDQDITPNIHSKKWKLTFDIFREQTEDEKKADLPQEGCRIRVELLKIDEDKVCIDFSRLNGNSWFFFQQF